jgi:hypothetical protein
VRLTRSDMTKLAAALGFFVVAAVGCSVNHNLGESATDGMSGTADGSSSGTSGTDGSTSSMSQTSATPSSSGDPSSEESSGSSSSSESSGSGESSGGTESCNGDGEIVQWVAGGSPVPGLDAKSRLALVGNCTVIDRGGGGQGEPPAEYQVTLDCTLDGFVDGVEVEALQVQPMFEVLSAMPLHVEIDDTLFLRVAAERWGLGAWNRWFILNTQTFGSFVLEGINADRLHPQAGDSSPLIDEIGQLLGDDGWYSPVDYQDAPGICDGKLSCGATARELQLETIADAAVLQAGESATLDGGEDQFAVHVSVTAAREYPGDVCDDVPVAWYDIGAVWVWS